MWKAPELNLRLRQREILKKITKSRTARSDHKQRAELILLFDQGVSNRQAAKKVELSSRQSGENDRRGAEWSAAQQEKTEVYGRAGGAPG